MRYLLALLCCFSLAAQQTVNNFTVKTNLTAGIINLDSTSFTNAALLYQHEDGGFAIRYGNPSDYKYSVFYTNGLTTLPAGLESLGTINSGNLITRYGFATPTNYPSGIPVGTFSVSTNILFIDSLTQSGGSFSFNPVRIRSSSTTINVDGGRLQFSSPSGTTTWITVTSLPTSTNSLPTGTIWNDGGTLKVVP